MAHDQNSVAGIVSAFLLGGIIGGLTGLLVAPQRGKKLRTDIGEKVTNLVQDGEQRVKSAASAVSSTAKELERKAEKLLSARSGRGSDEKREGRPSAKATGVGGMELRALLQREIPDELGHASYLSDLIADLGGDPRTMPEESERPDGLRDMLELNIKQEETDVENYRRHAELAESLGEVALKVRLEDIASDENKHARELRRLLRGL